MYSQVRSAVQTLGRTPRRPRPPGSRPPARDSPGEQTAELVLPAIQHRFLTIGVARRTGQESDDALLDVPELSTFKLPGRVRGLLRVFVPLRQLLPPALLAGSPALGSPRP